MIWLLESFIDLLQIGNPYFIVVAGLMIGLLHAFEPDHLSAVSTQLLHKKRNGSQYFSISLRRLTIHSSLRGALWGMGHTSSILLIGLLIAGLSLSIPSNFFVGAELVVGLMLVFLALMIYLNKNILKPKHVHPHQHIDGTSHTHPHSHGVEHKHGHKSYLIGCIHGLAGSGGIVALTAVGLGSFEMAVYFLILFGVGSVIGMTLASGALGIPFMLLSKKKTASKYLRYAVASVALVIGTNIVYSIITGISFLPN